MTDYIYPLPRRRAGKKPTQAEREALVDRSEYDAPGGVPEHHDERFPVTCRLCGAETTVTLSNLHTNDQERAWKAEHGGSRNRERCYHRKVTLPPRPPRLPDPGALNQEDARTLLRALGSPPGLGDRAMWRAYRRLRYLAQEEDQ